MRTPRCPILVLFFLIAGNQFAHSLQSQFAITQYQHGAHGMFNGLPADSVRSIAQSNDGYLWLATSGGLARFDGLGYQVFNTLNTPELTSDSITTLLKDRDGSLWIGTEGGGLLNYDGKTFKVFTTDDGLLDNSIKALSQDGDGKLWILTAFNLSVLDHDKFFSFTVQHPLSIFADDKGTLVGTENGFTVITKNKSSQVPGNAVTALYRNRKGEIWLGVRNTGLCKFHDGNISSVLQTEEILSILEDRNGSVWIGTRLGIRRLFGTSSLHPHIHTAVTMLFQDREGIVWAATSGEGLHSFRRTAFLGFGTDEGLNNPRTWCVLKDHAGSLWIGTDEGVSRMNNGETFNYATPSPVKTMAEGNAGSIWIGTPSGILRGNEGSFSMVIPNVAANSLITDKDGSLWIGAADGLRKLTSGKLQQISSDEITSLYLDPQDQLWIGTGTGLKVWTNGGLRDAPLARPITSIQQDHTGVLWAGSYGEVHCIRNGKVSTYRIGETSNPMVTGILDDEKGYLWISTTGGIFRARVEQGKFVSAPTVLADGLSSKQCATGNPAAFKSDHELWFATVNGAAKIDPYDFYVNKLRPPVIIQSMKVDRAPINNIQGNLKFRGPASRIEFEYAGLSFASPLKYRYVLQGYDEFWTNAGGQRRAVYTNLPPGKYRFKVLAGYGNVWNIAGASVSFEIQSTSLHLPKTGIIFLLIAAAIAGFVTGWILKKRQYVSTAN
jgi:ligand-binding sensor domain-containing protein